MKICILGDTHFGMRGDSLEFHKYYKKFYDNVFFPYLIENNIDTVFQLGDLFDRRKFINFNSLYLCRNISLTNSVIIIYHFTHNLVTMMWHIRIPLK